MFLNSQVLDPELAKDVERIESTFKGESVMAARVYESPAAEIQVRFHVTEPAKLTILEEFILRAASELDPCPTEEELAKALSLDPVFISTECKGLMRMNAIQATCSPEIVLTEEGKRFHKEGLIIRQGKEKECTCWIDCCTESIIRVKAVMGGDKPDRGQERFKELPVPADHSLCSNEERLAAILNLEMMREFLGPLGLHNPGAGQVVTDIIEVKYVDLVGEAVGVFAIHDLVDNRILFRVLDMTTRNFRGDLEEKIQGEDVPKEIGEGLLSAMGVSETISMPGDEPVTGVTPDYVKNYESQLRAELVEERSRASEKKPERNGIELQPEAPEGKGLGKLEYLTDKKIRPRFLEALKRAEQDVLIISPWVNKDVVDTNFINILKELAKKRVMVLMGWGIKEKEEDEYESMEPYKRKGFNHIKDSLRSIYTPEKVQSVALVWLGRHHSKDILIDRRIHMCGSHNWLSYRGDNRVRGESVYYHDAGMAAITVLAKPINYLDGKFSDAIKRMWKSYCGSVQDIAVRDACATAWVALRQERESVLVARSMLQENPQQKAETLDFLKMVCLCLRGRALGPESGSVSEFLCGLEDLVDKGGLLDGGSTSARSLKEARDILVSDLNRVAKQNSA